MSAIEDVIVDSKKSIMNRMVDNDFFETVEGNLVRLSAITSVEHEIDGLMHVSIFVLMVRNIL